MCPLSRAPALRNRVVIIIFLALALGGCGGSSGGGGPQPVQNALVIGSPSGPIYQQLSADYHVTAGTGSESAAGYQVLIYDGASVTPQEIQSYPTTENFLQAGEIIVVLTPDQTDRAALETVVGATALADSPALALFNSYSSSGDLRTVSMVEFPETLSEDPNQTVPPGPSGSPSPTADSANVAEVVPADDATLRRQTEQWRTLYESKYQEAKTAMQALSGVSPAQFAAAAVSDGQGISALAQASSGLDEISNFLNPAQEIAPSDTASRFVSSQPFFHFLPRTLNIESIYYQTRFRSVYPQAVTANQVELRGLCPYLPAAATFAMNPLRTTSSNINVETSTYRMLEQYNGTYVHEVIARQFITSAPAVSYSTTPIGTEKLTYCLGTASGKGWDCAGNSPFCGLYFTQPYPLSSTLGFNEQIASTLSWDATSAGMLTLDNVLPQSANNVSNITTSNSYSRTVSWSIQGGFDLGGGNVSGKNVGLNLGGNAGESYTWTWGTAQSINVPDWQITSNSLPPTPASTFNFYAFNGPNSLANLQAFSTTTGGKNVPSLATLTDLQANLLTERNESDWSTKGKATTLPPATATLTVAPVFNYGEVFNLYTLGPCASYPICPSQYVGLYPYGAIHTFTLPPVPIAMDFSKALMQPPKPATWTISATLNTTQNPPGFYPISGTVTLNQVSTNSTTILLGAEVYPFGNTQPADTVVKGLPYTLVIPAGRRSANFSAMAQNIGFPYNLRWWALQPTGQQIAYPMTVPAQ